MIQLNNITLNFGSRVLFEDMSLTLHEKQKVGLIGANGSGKSTLFALLLKQIETTLGDCFLPKEMRIAHVAQETSALAMSALDFTLQGDKTIYQLRQQMQKAERDEDYEHLATLHVQSSEIGAYDAEARAAQLLDGLGFSQEQQKSSVASFSGGWRVRLNLAQALMCPSDFLLLDEPTNHLDLNAIVWLEKWLQKYSGTLFVISHDREFLDRVTDHTAHLYHRNIKLYAGNYSSFEIQYQNQLALQQATYEKQQKEIKHMTSFVERFRYKASKAKQAQSRLKMLAKLEHVAAVQATSEFHFEFPDPGKLPSPILRANDISLGYGDDLIIKDVNLLLAPGDRIGLLGRNGAGKSTLIKGLLKQLECKSGGITYGHNLKIGYFAQHQIDTLDSTQSPLEHLQYIAKDTTTQQCRNYLGGFGFRGDMALTKINTFSGGEKSRLALALIVWQSPHLLLLDEPTNHLDLDMRNALTLALQSFQGAMVLVSHDRNLLDCTTERFMVVENQRLEDFDGDMRDYEAYLMKNAKVPVQQAKAVSSPPTIKRDAKTLARLEKKIVSFEEKIKGLNEQLADPALYEEHNEVKREALYKELEVVQSQLDEAEKNYY